MICLHSPLRSAAATLCLLQLNLAPGAMMPAGKALFFLGLFAVVISLAASCFITNCPPGGKRSGARAGGPATQCMPCGADRRGRCVGPNICCSPENGCHIKTSDTLVCQFEAMNPRLCKVPGPSCGANGAGVCASDGICCTTGQSVAIPWLFLANLSSLLAIQSHVRRTRPASASSWRT